MLSSFNNILSSMFSGYGYFFAMFAALKTTLSVALASLILGLILSIIFAILELVECKIIRWTTTIFITLIRSLPEILVVFIISLGIPYLILSLDIKTMKFISNINISVFWLGVISLALIFASYASQIIRGALLAVSKGQWESGYALGMNYMQIFFTIILPQTWKHALPGLGNQWLILLKDTALVSLIGLHDIMFTAESAFTSTQKPFTWYSLAAMIYLLVSLVSQYLQKILNDKITHYE